MRSIIPAALLGGLLLLPVDAFLTHRNPIDAWRTISLTVIERVEPPEPAVRVRVTAYCGGECCTGKWHVYNRTASGTKPRRYITVAADTDVFPFGTVIYLPGIGMVTVEDRGGAIKGNHLDIYVGLGPNKHEEALQFGSRFLTARVVYQPEGMR